MLNLGGPCEPCRAFLTMGVTTESLVYPINVLFTCLSASAFTGRVASTKNPEDRTPTMQVFLRLAPVRCISGSLLCASSCFKVLFPSVWNVVLLPYSFFSAVYGAAVVLLVSNSIMLFDNLRAMEPLDYAFSLTFST